MNKQQLVQTQTLYGTPFLLQSNLVPTKCIHLQSGEGHTYNGDVCHIWDQIRGSYTAQEWLYDGKLIRSAKYPSKCIHLKSGSGDSFNGDACHLWDVQPGDYPAQEWIIDGKLIKSVKCPDKCIHLEGVGSRRDNGTICHLWDIVEGSFPAQEWTVVYLPPPATATQLEPGNLPLRSLTSIQVFQLLGALEFNSIRQRFLELEINGHALSCCTSLDELKELGMDISLKIKSLRETIMHLKQHGVPPALLNKSPYPQTAYRIHSVKVPSKCIHLVSGDGGASSNGDGCHLWDQMPGAYKSLAWIFDGKLIKSAKDPSKCIHLKSGTGKSSNGDICHLWTIQPGNYPPQEWIYDGKLLRSVKCPNKCIHLKSGSSPDLRNGDVCHLWDIIDGSYPAQEWTLIPDEKVQA
ncbi:hypothetical protein THRCLA_22869 [Thraustotheca clavata]|uniref:SAM domain-containing protein n=1 Tax=Thraustotheca clavata TaxID=74557 RepID=A0A1V9YS65_9STRA|nr:hypothetical protein THRCLA_22869 [Thraustotheca clavata]